MAGTLQAGMPSGEIVRNALSAAGTAGTAGAVRHGPAIVVSFAPSQTTTATAGISWINPEASTILVTEVYYRITGSAGTGTINVGISSDGTGSGNNVFAAGTLTAGLHFGTAGTGSTNSGLRSFLLGPGGTGTNNSIVGLYGDTPTSTAGTLRFYLQYYVVQ